MSLVKQGDSWTEGTHIAFRLLRLSESGKTKIFQVVAKDGNVPLGRVSFFGRWRKYIFEPNNETLYEQTCLREIAEFIEGETKEQRRTQGKA